jgi:hypothetical protein
MLAIVSGACSVVDSIAIDIWARCGCSRRLLKEESGGQQQSCRKGGPAQDSNAHYRERHERACSQNRATAGATDTNVAFLFSARRK